MPDIPFASTDDIEARGHAIAVADLARAEKLLADASQMLVDEMPAAVDRAAPATLERIVCAMVIRELASADVRPGIETTQFGVGIFQESYKWSNPTGGLYISKAERRALRGPARAFSVNLAPDAAVP